MQKALRIFQPDAKLAAVGEASGRIAAALSEHYREIISGMVGKAETTRRTYERNCEHFLAYIQAQGIDAHTFGAYREALAEIAHISPKTKNAYLAAARALLREALKYGLLPVDITANVPRFKTGRGHVKDGLTRLEVVAVWGAIGSIRNRAQQAKARALFSLMAFEGLRQAEAQSLRLADVNLAERYILIKGKGKDGREKFYITARTASALAGHLEASAPAAWLFPSPSAPSAPMTLRALRKMFTAPAKGLFARAGLPAGKSLHGLRHYNITATLEATGGDLAATRRRSRHSSYEMLTVYDDARLMRSDVDALEAHITGGL